MPVSSLGCKWIGVERINGEGTAETGESGAEETAMTTLAGSNHTFLKKIYFHRAHRGPNRGHGAEPHVRSVTSVGWAPCPLLTAWVKSGGNYLG